MASTALERVLHYECPEWSDSIRAARLETDFSFDLSDRELWQWLVSGGHAKAEEIAKKEVSRLGTEEFYLYYLCCFYSEYELPGGTIDFETIKGPPWVTFRCPATGYGSAWQESIQQARVEFYRKLGLDHAVSPNTVSGDFLSWFWYEEGCEEVAKTGLRHVKELDMEDINSVLWVCCLLPRPAKWMLSKSRIFLERFPHIMEWNHFAATCAERDTRRRVRGYPSYIDWNEGVSPPQGLPILPSKPSIHYTIELDKDNRTTLAIQWDPLIATSEKDLSEAVKALHKYYEYCYQQREIEQAHGILPRLSVMKRKGGKPRGGPAADALALKCAKLKDEEGRYYKEIGDRFGFALQKDSYGNLSQCSTARRLVKKGRQLLQQKQ